MIMKISSIKQDPLNHSSSKPLDSPQPPDLIPKPPRRKIKKSGAARRSRPETPLLRWKFGEGSRENNGVQVKEKENESSEVGRKGKAASSTRKLAAALWRMQLPEGPTSGGDRIAVESEVDKVAVHFHAHHSCNPHISPSKDLMQSPRSVCGRKNGHLSKVEPTSQFSNFAMEGATKWDPINRKTLDDVKQVYGRPKVVDQQGKFASLMSSLEAELEQARARINELETERRSSKKKVEHFLRKLSEERAAWRSREHEKVRAIIDDIKSDLNREKRNRQRLEIVNSKLVNELADAKLSGKRYMHEYEKELEGRELIEEVCNELAKKIGEDNAEIEELRRESMGLHEEVEEERKMLQIAEVWREERVQMKLIDAKLILEDKYTQLNWLIAEIESFFNSRGAAPGTAELLRQAATSMNVENIRELTYEPPNPDDIFSTFEDVNYSEPNERQIEPYVASPPASRDSRTQIVGSEANGFNNDNIQRHSNGNVDQSCDLGEDGSDWETVSHFEDQGSSYSPGARDPSMNGSRRDSYVSRSGSEEDENRGDGTPIPGISEVCSIQNRQQKKASSISRLWKPCPDNGENYENRRLSNARLSNGAIHSTDNHSSKGELIPPDFAGHLSSLDMVNSHINRGKKGCVKWPRSAHKAKLNAKLLEARTENQKIQLRQVLKQNI